ncbi:MAG: hypothetical protein WCO99_13270 [Planctomycetota bacterium]
MAVLKDDMVLRLLCHLAWLRDTGGSGSKQRTLAWARRVYNSATHLQFRFVYPHRSQDRVIEFAQPLLAKAIEAVVDAASDAIKPLRSGAGAVEENSALDAATALALRDALTVLLNTATEVGWGGVHAPKEDVTLDRTVNPLRLLSAWRRRHGGGKQSDPHDASGSTATDEAMVELCKGIATKLVANHSRVMGRVPATVYEAFHAAADAYLAVDVEEFGRTGGDQLIQRLAAQLLRTPARRVR